jgi:hypothetical protein
MVQSSTLMMSSFQLLHQFRSHHTTDTLTCNTLPITKLPLQNVKTSATLETDQLQYTLSSRGHQAVTSASVTTKLH